MQKKGRKMTGQKQERKRTISFFILRSGGRIYFLACTTDAPFLWLSLPCISCQARVFMKQKDTGSLLLTPPRPSNTPASANQRHSSQFLLSFFFFKPRTRSKICEILFDSSLEKTLHFTAPGYLLLSIAVLSAFYLGPKALKYFLICRLKAVFLGKEKASVLHTWKSLKMWK